MTIDIKDSIGGVISDDTEKLLSQFNANFEAIENNFNSLKQSIEELQSKLVQTVAEAKDAQIKHFN
jgi:archaellum component FlaC